MLKRRELLDATMDANAPEMDLGPDMEPDWKVMSREWTTDANWVDPAERASALGPFGIVSVSDSLLACGSVC